MKFNEIIQDILFEGAKTILSPKDFPSWVKEVFAENKLSFGTISVETNAEPTIGGQIVDHDVMKVFFFSDGQVVRKNVSPHYNKSAIKDKDGKEDKASKEREIEHALYQGGKIRLWDEVVPGKPQMILVTHTHPKKAVLYAHPNQMPKQIESKNLDFSDDEKKVLLITKTQTSAYRNEYYKRYGVLNKIDSIKESLKNKKVMSANGALNIAGKNVVEQLPSLETLFGHGK